jgi:membrane protein DedA with SNARE-associated domain
MEFFTEEMKTVVTWVTANKSYAIPVVFLLAFAESLAVISLLVPAWGALVAFGALIAIGALDYVPIWISASVGAALGDWVSYWFGVKYKYGIANMYPLSKYPDLIPKGEAFFKKWGVWAIVLGRFTGPLRASVPLIAGITAMPKLIFQAANWSSAFLWAGLLLSPGVINYWIK